jgi:hypothetical protein
VRLPRVLACVLYQADNRAMARAPSRYSVPDAHELHLAAQIELLGLKVRLVPSTPAQRKARASYWRRKEQLRVPAARPQ